MSIHEKSNKPEQLELEIYYRTDFLSADVKYRALVEDGIKNLRSQNHLSDCTRPWALSYIEAEIFEIDPELVPALYWGYERYESLVGSFDAYFGAYREQERIDYAKYYRGDLENEMQTAINFMEDACLLPSLQCFGWVLKIYAAGLRGGLFHNASHH